MATFRATTERVLVLQPRTLAEVDAEQAAQRPTLERRTLTALEAVWGAVGRARTTPPVAPTPPPPPIAPTPAPTAAPRSARRATSGRRSSRATRVAGPTRAAAPKAPTPAPERPAPRALRFFDPDDPEPDYGAPFRRGWDAWMQEKEERRRGW